MDVKQILTQGLTRASARHTAETLGDRSTYVGASDASGCPRKAIMGKRNPGGTHTLAAMIRMLRGHLAENILVTAYRQAGITFWHQYELVPTNFPGPCRIHPDLIVEEVAGETGTLEVQEIKTTEGIPSQPYDSWVRQLNLQMGALRQADPGKLVKGKVVAMDLNTGQAKEYPIDFDPQLFEFTKGRIGLIWQALQDGTPDPLPCEKGPLCGWCGFAGNCPALDHPAGLIQLPIEEYLLKILELREVKNSAEKELDRTTALINGILDEQGIEQAMGGSLMVKRLPRKKNGLDLELLKAEQPGIFETYRKVTPFRVLDIR